MDAKIGIKIDALPQLAAELTPEQMQSVAGAWEIYLYDTWAPRGCAGVHLRTYDHLEVYWECNGFFGGCHYNTHIVGSELRHDSSCTTSV